MDLIVTVRMRPRGYIDMIGVKETLAYDLENKYGDIVYIDVKEADTRKMESVRMEGFR